MMTARLLGVVARDLELGGVVIVAHSSIHTDIYNADIRETVFTTSGHVFMLLATNHTGIHHSGFNIYIRSLKIILARKFFKQTKSKCEGLKLKSNDPQS